MRKLGIILCFVLIMVAALSGCNGNESNESKIDVSEITVSAEGLTGSGTTADPYVKNIDVDDRAEFSFAVKPNEATDQTVSVKYADVNGSTVTEKTTSSLIELSGITVSAFQVKGLAAGIGYILVKSNDGKASALVKVEVNAPKVLIVSAETAKYKPENYYAHDEDGEIALGPDGTTPVDAVERKHPFTGAPWPNDDGSIKYEQIRNIYKDYVNGFDSVSDTDRNNAQSNLYNADYYFKGIAGTTLNATFGELFANKENFQNYSLISSTNEFENLDQLDRVRYYKNMLYNHFQIDENVSDKTLNVKYYSDGSLKTEVSASNSPIQFAVKDNNATSATKLVSFQAPKGGNIWAKFYCGSNENDFCVVKAEIAETYGDGVQKADFDAKAASDTLVWNFNETQGAVAAQKAADWRVSLLQTTEKLQVKAFCAGAPDTAGNLDGAKGISVVARFETFTNMGIPLDYAVLKTENTADQTKNQYMLPYVFTKAYASIWNKITLPATGVTEVTATVASAKTENPLEFRISLVDPTTGEQSLSAWTKVTSEGTISFAIPAGLLGKTVVVAVEGRNTNPAFNADTEMHLFGVDIH